MNEQDTQYYDEAVLNCKAQGYEGKEFLAAFEIMWHEIGGRDGPNY